MYAKDFYYVNEAVGLLISNNRVKTVTVFKNKHSRVRATYVPKLHEIRIQIGAPNFREREFVKKSRDPYIMYGSYLKKARPVIKL